ncbi:MAG: DUF2530 domain-containing protein [Actinobacteria bacterium]|nr:DUF2530 domain-containing protein [Actinomycetota bacterium]NBY15579.1 DUF2530 domain-containing protein [Actinomycetota bacterium]
MESEKHSTAPELQPIAVDGIREVTIGTMIWAIGLFVCLLFNEHLTSRGYSDAKWICLAGVVLGLLGQIYTRRRVNRLNLIGKVIDR